MVDSVIERLQPYLKSALLLALIYGASLLAPSHPLDPWGLLNPKKVLHLVLALSLIQVLGDVFLRILGARAGALALGFFGGLISSTALTASLARESKKISDDKEKAASLAYLSATAAMILEAAVLFTTGTSEVHLRILIFFIAPLATVLLLILISYHRTPPSSQIAPPHDRIKLGMILNLASFIVVALGLSKLLQIYFGVHALLPLTYIVSLFEIHGSVIANVQLHNAEVVSLEMLGDLFTLSLLASYTSKFFLVFTLGSSKLKRRILIWSLLIVAATLISWAGLRLVK